MAANSLRESLSNLDIEQFIREGQNFLTQLKQDRQKLSKEVAPNAFAKKSQKEEFLSESGESEKEDSFERHESNVYQHSTKDPSKALEVDWEKESEVISGERETQDHQRQLAHKILQKYSPVDRVGPETIPEEESVTDVSVVSPLNSSHKMDRSSMRNRVWSNPDQEKVVRESKFAKPEFQERIAENIFPNSEDSPKTESLQPAMKEDMLPMHTFGKAQFGQLEDLDVSLSESDEERPEKSQGEKEGRREANEDNFIQSIQQKIQNLKRNLKTTNSWSKNEIDHKNAKKNQFRKSQKKSVSRSKANRNL